MRNKEIPRQVWNSSLFFSVLELSDKKYGKFRCMMCTDCCVFGDYNETPLIFYWEVETLRNKARSVGASIDIEPYLSVEDAEGIFTYIYRWKIQGRCPFLLNGKCIIHEDKPLSCRIFPLIADIESSRIYVSGRCRWVREHKELISPSSIPEVFDEFELAVKIIGMVSKFIEISKNNGWRIIIHGRKDA